MKNRIKTLEKLLKKLKTEMYINRKSSGLKQDEIDALEDAIKTLKNKEELNINYETMWLILKSKILEDNIKYKTNIIDKDGYSFKEIINMIRQIEENNKNIEENKYKLKKKRISEQD